MIFRHNERPPLRVVANFGSFSEKWIGHNQKKTPFKPWTILLPSSMANLQHSQEDLAAKPSACIISLFEARLSLFDTQWTNRELLERS